MGQAAPCGKREELDELKTFAVEMAELQIMEATMRREIAGEAFDGAIELLASTQAAIAQTLALEKRVAKKEGFDAAVSQATDHMTKLTQELEAAEAANQKLSGYIDGVTLVGVVGQQLQCLAAEQVTRSNIEVAEANAWRRLMAAHDRQLYDSCIASLTAEVAERTRVAERLAALADEAAATSGALIGLHGRITATADVAASLTLKPVVSDFVDAMGRQAAAISAAVARTEALAGLGEAYRESVVVPLADRMG